MLPGRRLRGILIAAHPWFSVEGDPRFIVAEMAEMGSAVLAKTAGRQVLGVMNEFVFMAERSISTGHSEPEDLVGLSVWLADAIVGPVSKDDGSTPPGALRRVLALSIRAAGRGA